LVRAVDELERHGILRAGSGSSWDFAHELFRRSAYRQLSEPRRRLFHHQIAQAMGRLPDSHGAQAAALLHHAVLGGDLLLAARACLAAGDRSLKVAGPAEAEKAAARGLQLLDHLPSEARLDLEIPLLRVAVFARTDGRIRRDLDAALSRAILAAQAAGRSDRQALGLDLLATLSWREQDYVRAEQSTLRAAEVAHSTDPMTYAKTLATTSRCLTLLERAMPRAVGMAFEARSVAQRHGLEVPETAWALCMAHHFRGDEVQARLAGEQAVAVYQRIEGHWQKSMCLLELAMIGLEAGRFAEARECAAQVGPLAEKAGAGSEGPFAAALTAIADYAEGKASVTERLRAALCALEEVDAKSLLCYALNAAAEVDLDAGRYEGARTLAARALAAAETVERGSEICRARAILMRAALGLGDRNEAKRLASILLEDPPDEAVVGARAKRLVERSLMTLRRST
jgi:hypothetical protein